MSDVRKKLEPVEREVRKRLGNFILAEDDHTLEGVVLGALAARQGSLSIVETFTGGQIAARIAHLPGAEKVFRRGIVARELGEVCAAVGLEGASAPGEMTREAAEAVARAARRATGSTHALAVLMDLDEGADRIDFGGTICLAIATEREVASRRSRILGGREWVRLGACEMGLDCLRRNLPLDRPESRALIDGWTRRPGMLGLRFTFLQPHQRTWPTDGTMDWLWPAAERAGLPVALLAASFLPLVGQVAERHRGLPLIVDHLGRPSGTKDEAAWANLRELLALAK